MAGDAVTITIRADNGDAVRAFRDTSGQLRDMRGRFVSESSIMSRSMSQFGKSIGNVKGYLIPLATAAVPLMASMTAATVKTAGAAAGAGVAVGAFGVALAGQVSSLSEASEAQKKYRDAVVKSGRGSKEAAEAQRAVQASLAGMPNATARASVALGTLKTTFQDFSDSNARFTMAPVEKSFTLMERLLPKLTPMVQGTSTQLDRLVSVAGGAMATPGFDALTDKFAAFANDSLKNAVDGIIHFSRALSEGEVSGPVKAFMDYADSNGPAVQETLKSIGSAVTTLVEAAAEAGPGMLTLVNAAAGLVASLPPELVATVMQLAVGLKLVSVAGAAAAAVSGGIATLGTRIAALQAASAAAGGGMTGLVAAFGTLGKAAKASIIVAAIAALVVAVEQLSSIGDDAAPDVDKLTTSLSNLGRTGKATGYVAAEFGKDFGKLKDQIDKVINPSVTESINNWGEDISGGLLSAGEATEEFTKSMDSIDDALTNMVKGGKADLAKAAVKSMMEGMSPEQAEKFRDSIDGYDQAMADMALEAKLTADSMGVFGSAAADTSAKLDAQKSAADGLRASILALNDVNRSAHDAQTNFERSLDGLTESFKEHGNTLNKDTAAGQANRDAMSAAAKAQDELIAAGLAAGESMGSMTKKSAELRETMMRLATDAFDGNKAKATEYVNTLLGVPGDIKTLVKLEREEAIAGLETVRAAIQETPDAKEIKVDTLNAAAIAALEAVGLKTKQLPDGKTAVFTANGQALGSIGSVSTALNNLNGKTAYTFTKHTIRYITEYQKRFLTGRSQHDITGATGGLFTGRSFKRGYADGGLVEGPGTGTSDDVFAPWLSNGEFVMRAAAVQKYGEKFMQMLNAGAIDMPKMAKGGRVGGVRSLARGARDEIRAATSGATEDRLLKLMSSIAGGHMKMATALKKVSSELDKASSKLKDLKSSASQLSGSVKSGIISGANITRAAGKEDSQVTINTLMSQMQGSAANSKQFASMLKTLRKRGLSSSLLRQIAEAGIEGGGMETAAAILGGGKGEIKQLNKLQSQISTAGKSAGKTTADAVYAGTIRGQEKLVKALDRLADALKPKKKAAGGIGGGLTVVGEEGAELVRLPHGSTVYPAGQSRQMAWASMLTPPPASRAPVQARSQASGWGERPLAIQLQLGTTELGEVIIDPVRKAITTRGGLRATFPQDFR
ncbi:phage tail protein [Streptomyces ossamyceticus]|uniref:phage tail protein n=1 Tax=Streptomyces ossamyceticus TaxID=249581 RepID=UPI003416346E